MSDQGEHSITLSRTIDAPADELFAAWTDPALLEQWQAEQVEFEPFEGGKFRFETTDADEPGVSHVISGTIASYEQDCKLVELWHMEGEGSEHDSTLIVTFAPVDQARTEITIVEIAEAHADAESRIFSIEAWHEALNELAELLE
ncbi:SRPBCC family protein [Pelagibacterium halotolerans]|uniref:Activator of Hsp90 ATPase homologue 1/2-like C-terminal domain-containing protein n=1 Tax=Pelagibacterium halotolerans (strain DSM 22347 / JCM 15775 / CGMCC 1.7692 / B2) TaxID=1082931 RepID=G4R844_PELHB|nr:SRPBCC family protein [Pelagibacterium halotolerans]AEQ51322.1 hypothetical protein KKY_1298 [Pelagibacterium halotolerans B2]QJR18827.1 SRPBCC domain-containing protein [Pelagibacterium halotolerans]SEA93713.1 Uncharacterized conserved protein YndB, AHSA1/START domain [Pelagibacterium halotolerans]